MFRVLCGTSNFQHQSSDSSSCQAHVLSRVPVPAGSDPKPRSKLMQEVDQVFRQFVRHLALQRLADSTLPRPGFLKLGQSVTWQVGIHKKNSEARSELCAFGLVNLRCAGIGEQSREQQVRKAQGLSCFCSG